jgi:hypothetical protein
VESNGPESVFSERIGLSAQTRIAVNGRDLGGSVDGVGSGEETKVDAARCDERRASEPTWTMAKGYCRRFMP